MTEIKLIQPGSFEPDKHWYPRALNAQIHPQVDFFFSLSRERIVQRYCHLHPLVDPEYLRTIMTYQPKYFYWAGADLLNVTSVGAKKQMVVVETNSCPSGQKSMPLLNDHQEMGGYLNLIEKAFKAFLKGKRLGEGSLAVIYDKNLMEASGYAAAMAESFKEKVFLIPLLNGQPNRHLRIQEGFLELRYERQWIRLRAAFRYLTQKPWNRLPIGGKTPIFNPIIACLAGGRNKLVAAKAYEFLNADLKGTGLKVNIPETIWDVQRPEIPLWVKKLGGHAVIKVPYSNAGQGVYTITNDAELEAFMELKFEYSQFIVQSLIGNYHWSSKTEQGRFYHVGTMPNKKGQSFVADLRLMIQAGPNGYEPLGMYARRAAAPLVSTLDDSVSSWEVLGTNLSVKKADNKWDSDTSRLLLMDRKDFNKLGLGQDEMIEAYIQTILASIAIDKMAAKLINTKGKLNRQLFQSLNNDPTLIEEILL